MFYATISADIVDSTKLKTADTIRIKKLLKDFLEPMKKVSEGSWGRVVKGDAFECVLEDAKHKAISPCYDSTITVTN